MLLQILLCKKQCLLRKYYNCIVTVAIQNSGRCSDLINNIQMYMYMVTGKASAQSLIKISL